MKDKTLVFMAAIVAVFLAGCGTEMGGGSKGLTISGTIQNAGNMQVYLDKVGVNPANASLVIGKADADGSGNYALKFEEPMSEGIYRLRVGEQRVFLVLDGKERNINVSGDLAALNMFQYNVSGSAGSAVFKDVMQKVIAQSAPPEAIAAVADTTANPLTAMLIAVSSLKPDAAAMAIHKKVEQRVEKAYPGSSHVTDYRAYQAMAQQQAANLGGGDGFAVIAEGERKAAPDIALPSPSGKEYSLSSLKGKVVLLDFWASWCGPCRRENPNVVNIYNRYKDKGFTVFSVSMDGVDSRQAAAVGNDPKQLEQFKKQTKDAWKAAIEKDGLVWNYHVSDLKKWECAPAKVYGVSSIPRTFMIDKEGRIAAVNLKGAQQIEQVLQQLL